MEMVVEAKEEDDEADLARDDDGTEGPRKNKLRAALDVRDKVRACVCDVVVDLHTCCQHASLHVTPSCRANAAMRLRVRSVMPSAAMTARQPARGGKLWSRYDELWKWRASGGQTAKDVVGKWQAVGGGEEVEEVVRI